MVGLEPQSPELKATSALRGTANTNYYSQRSSKTIERENQTTSLLKKKETEKKRHNEQIEKSRKRREKDGERER